MLCLVSRETVAFHFSVAFVSLRVVDLSIALLQALSSVVCWSCSPVLTFLLTFLLSWLVLLASSLCFTGRCVCVHLDYGGFHASYQQSGWRSAYLHKVCPARESRNSRVSISGCCVAHVHLCCLHSPQSSTGLLNFVVTTHLGILTCFHGGRKSGAFNTSFKQTQRE